MSLQKIIDDFLLEKQKEKEKRKGSGKFKPYLLGRCFRAQTWAQRDVPVSEGFDARTLKIFQCGTIFHEFVQEFIEDTDKEVMVEDDMFLGYADVVGDDIVYDIKSQHSRAFWYMQKSGYNVMEQKENNWLQLALYAKLLEKPKMCLVFISKDDLTIAEYLQMYSVWKGKLEEEIKTLKMYKDIEHLPPAEPRAYKNKDGISSECKYCSWRTKCKDIEGL